MTLGTWVTRAGENLMPPHTLTNFEVQRYFETQKKKKKKKKKRKEKKFQWSF